MADIDNALKGSQGDSITQLLGSMSSQYDTALKQKLQGQQELHAETKRITGEMENYQHQMDQLRPPEMAPLPAPPDINPKTDPRKAWGSLAMMFAVFGSLMTRSHMTTALTAAAGVMNAYKQNDIEKADREFKKWQVSSENALKVHQFQMDTYKASLDRIKEGKAGAKAELAAYAAAFKDDNTLAMMQRPVGDLIHHLDSMQRIGAQMDMQRERLHMMHDQFRQGLEEKYHRDDILRQNQIDKQGLLEEQVKSKEDLAKLQMSLKESLLKEQTQAREHLFGEQMRLQEEKFRMSHDSLLQRQEIEQLKLEGLRDSQKSRTDLLHEQILAKEQELKEKAELTADDRRQKAMLAAELNAQRKELLDATTQAKKDLIEQQRAVKSEELTGKKELQAEGLAGRKELLEEGKSVKEGLLSEQSKLLLQRYQQQSSLAEQQLEAKKETLTAQTDSKKEIIAQQEAAKTTQIQEQREAQHAGNLEKEALQQQSAQAKSGLIEQQTGAAATRLRERKEFLTQQNQAREQLLREQSDARERFLRMQSQERVATQQDKSSLRAQQTQERIDLLNLQSQSRRDLMKEQEADHERYLKLHAEQHERELQDRLNVQHLLGRSSNPLTNAKVGIFRELSEAHASGDPERIRKAEQDAADLRLAEGKAAGGTKAADPLKDINTARQLYSSMYPVNPAGRRVGPDGKAAPDFETWYSNQWSQIRSPAGAAVPSMSAPVNMPGTTPQPGAQAPQTPDGGAQPAQPPTNGPHWWQNLLHGSEPKASGAMPPKPATGAINIQPGEPTAKDAQGNVYVVRGGKWVKAND